MLMIRGLNLTAVLFDIDSGDGETYSAFRQTDRALKQAAVPATSDSSSITLIALQPKFATCVYTGSDVTADTHQSSVRRRKSRDLPTARLVIRMSLFLSSSDFSSLCKCALNLHMHERNHRHHERHQTGHFMSNWCTWTTRN